MALLSPVLNENQFSDNNGKPLSGGKIFAYASGTTSHQAVFHGPDGEVAYSQPIELDSSGRTGTIWLSEDTLYDLVLTKSDGTTVLKMFHGVRGIPVPLELQEQTLPVWRAVESFTWVSGTKFLAPYSEVFTPGDRVSFTDSGTHYGTVLSTNTNGSQVEVTILPDGQSLAAGTSAIKHSAIREGRPVDAEAVSFASSRSYESGSLGHAVKTLQTTLGSVQTEVNSSNSYWVTSGDGTNFVATPVPAITNYANSRITVKFHTNGGAAPSININGLGAVALSTYDSSGTKVPFGSIKANQIIDLVYDENGFVAPSAVLPAAPVEQVVVTSGGKVCTSNQNFTIPEHVTKIKVTVIGGGGGSSPAWLVSTGESGDVVAPTQAGGHGGAAVSFLAVAAGQVYAVYVGAGGTAGSSSGSNGGAGAGSSFGNLVMASGGGGAQTSGNNGASGANGVGTLGDMKGSSPYLGYGAGGTNGSPGTGGLVLIEW